MKVDQENYYVYIITNIDKSVLDTGLAGALNVRLEKLNKELNAARALKSNPDCKYLLYWEQYEDMSIAMVREKEVKKMSIRKKRALINKVNPEWKFLNEEVTE